LRIFRVQNHALDQSKRDLSTGQWQPVTDDLHHVTDDLRHFYKVQVIRHKMYGICYGYRLVNELKNFSMVSYPQICVTLLVKGAKA
jgi:hypothetical protein